MRQSALKTKGQGRQGAGGECPLPYFGRLVHSIKIGGSRLYPKYSYLPPPLGFSDLPTALEDNQGRRHLKYLVTLP